jgi:protein-S-isoprenylcysteine O-methyltransferase Ste14
MAVLAVYALWQAEPCWEGLKLGLTWACLGEGLRLWAIGYAGEPTRGEKLEAPVLVTAGPYAHVRNPLYVGNLLNSLGVLWAAFYPWACPRAILLWLLAVALYRILVTHEEKFLLGLFGREYADYCTSVPPWWPRVRGYARAKGNFCWRKGLYFERTTLIWWALTWGLLVVKGWMAL